MWHDRSSAVNVAVSSHHPRCVHATFCLDGTISGLTYGTRRALCRMVAKNKESVGALTIGREFRYANQSKRRFNSLISLAPTCALRFQGSTILCGTSEWRIAITFKGSESILRMTLVECPEWNHSSEKSGKPTRCRASSQLREDRAASNATACVMLKLWARRYSSCLFHHEY